MSHLPAGLTYDGREQISAHGDQRQGIDGALELPVSQRVRDRRDRDNQRRAPLTAQPDVNLRLPGDGRLNAETSSAERTLTN